MKRIFDKRNGRKCHMIVPGKIGNVLLLSCLYQVKETFSVDFFFVKNSKQAFQIAGFPWGKASQNHFPVTAQKFGFLPVFHAAQIKDQVFIPTIVQCGQGVIADMWIIGEPVQAKRRIRVFGGESAKFSSLMQF